MGSAFDPVVVEPAIVPDTFITAMHDVETVGEGIYRFTFVVAQRKLNGEQQELVVTARLVAHRNAVLHGAWMALKAVGWKCCEKMARAVH